MDRLLLCGGLVVAGLAGNCAHAQMKVVTTPLALIEDRQQTEEEINRSLLPQPSRTSQTGPALDSVPPLPRPSRGTVLGHLRRAAEHLHQAGLDDDADRIRLRADTLFHDQMAELAEKRKQLHQLQCDIAELEQDLNLAPAYSLQCVIGQVSVSKLRRHQVVLTSSGGTEFPISRLLQGEAGAFHVAHGHEHADLIESLQKAAAFESQGNFQLFVVAGQQATIGASKHLPAHSVVQTSGVQSAPEALSGDCSLETMVEPRGDNRILLTVAPHFGCQAESQSLTSLDGVRIPLRAKTQISMDLDKTVIMTSPVRERDGEKIVDILFVTPSVAEQPRTLEREAKLEPIPEATLIR